MHVTDIRLFRNVTGRRTYTVYNVLYLCGCIAPTAYINSVIIQCIICRNSYLETLAAAQFACFQSQSIVTHIRTCIIAYRACIIRHLRNHTVIVYRPITVCCFPFRFINSYSRIFRFHLYIFKFVMCSPTADCNTALKCIVFFDTVQFNLCRQRIIALII